MRLYEDITWCDSCGVEITWGPVVIEGRSLLLPGLCPGI